MPQHKSTEKRMRTSAIARLRNRQDRSRFRLAEKRVLQTKDLTSAKKELESAFSILDHMAAKGVLHTNTAANHKSKLSRFVSSLKA
jgi:small subunit ribosomal protein S20